MLLRLQGALGCRVYAAAEQPPWHRLLQAAAAAAATKPAHPALHPPCRAATSKRPRTAGGGRGGGGVGSTLTPPKPVTYADLGGIEPILDDIRELIEYPLKHPEVGALGGCWVGGGAGGGG